MSRYAAFCLRGDVTLEEIGTFTRAAPQITLDYCCRFPRRSGNTNTAGYGSGRYGDSPGSMPMRRHARQAFSPSSTGALIHRTEQI